MAHNPVMLTALAVVHWNEKRLPEQRAYLYESVLGWLAKARDSREGRPNPERCITLLQNLALEMQESLEQVASELNQLHKIECRFRVGLNTGAVVVGKIGDNLDMDYTALGDTVNLAARMQQMGEPGRVYVSENTHRLVRDYFEFEPLGELTVKGMSEPISAYVAVRSRSVRTRSD